MEKNIYLNCVVESNPGLYGEYTGFVHLHLFFLHQCCNISVKHCKDDKDSDVQIIWTVINENLNAVIKLMRVNRVSIDPQSPFMQPELKSFNNLINAPLPNQWTSTGLSPPSLYMLPGSTHIRAFLFFLSFFLPSAVTEHFPKKWPVVFNCFLCCFLWSGVNYRVDEALLWENVDAQTVSHLGFQSHRARGDSGHSILWEAGGGRGVNG